MDWYSSSLLSMFKRYLSSAPNDNPTVKFCVFILSFLTAAASWWYGFQWIKSLYQLNLVALISILKYSLILSITLLKTGQFFSNPSYHPQLNVYLHVIHNLCHLFVLFISSKSFSYIPSLSSFENKSETNITSLDAFFPYKFLLPTCINNLISAGLWEGSNVSVFFSSYFSFYYEPYHFLKPKLIFSTRFLYIQLIYPFISFLTLHSAISSTESKT